MRGTWIFTVGVDQIEALLLIAGYLLFALAIVSAPLVLRRCLLALIVPLGVTLLLTRVGLGTRLFAERAVHDGVSDALPPPAQWLTLALVPTLSFAVAVAIVHRRERPARSQALERVVQWPSSEAAPPP